jgi:hypothetical protein
MKITRVIVKPKSKSIKTVVAYSPQIEAAIRMKAYELYLNRSKGDAGNEVEDWLTAERAVLQKQKRSTN